MDYIIKTDGKDLNLNLNKKIFKDLLKLFLNIFFKYKKMM
jgi:hypothetical protein